VLAVLLISAFRRAVALCADLEMPQQSKEQQKGWHSRKQGGEKLLIKPLSFTVSLFPTAFFFSSMLNLFLKVPRDEATITFLKELFQSQQEESDFILFDIIFQHSYSNVITMHHTKNSHGQEK